MPIELTNDKAGVSSYEGYLGILGSQITKRFHIVLDYFSKKIYLKPNKFFSDTFEFPFSGMRLRKKNNQIFVDTVVDESPAYKAGVRAGDVVLSINDVSYEKLSKYRNIMKEEGKTLRVKVKTTSNETKTYTFQLKRLL